MRTARDMDWGLVRQNEWFYNSVAIEIFHDRIYERFFEVEEGDVVVDMGASCGPFSVSILDKKPKHIYALEPHPELFKTLQKNLRAPNTTCLNYGIADETGTFELPGLWDEQGSAMWSGKGEAKTLTFDDFLKFTRIEQIDFLKVDCEGCEYSVLNKQDWIMNNVKKIAGEFHFGGELRQSFESFVRGFLLKLKPEQYHICDVEGVDLKEYINNPEGLNFVTSNLGYANVYIDLR